MKRNSLYVLLGLIVLVAAGCALVLARPELLAALRQLRRTDAPDAGLFCVEHGVPEAYCTTCHAELKDKLPLCSEHGGLPEAICTKCRPEAAEQLKLKMCPKGHGLPEHFCTECPSGSAAMSETIDDGWCFTHNRPEESCAECAATASTSGQRECQALLPIIRLATPEIARKIGLETAQVEARQHTDVLVGNAEIAYHEHAYAEVRPRVTGLVHEIHADHGQLVRKGETIAVMDSAEVGTAKAAYLAALPTVELAEATLERTRSLTRANALPMKDELEARATLNRAKADLLNAAQRLRNLGLNDQDLAEVAKKQDTSSLLRVVAPLDGTVIERHAVTGEAVEAMHQLVAIADLREMWAWIDVYESEIERVRDDQPVTFRLAGREDRVFRGKVHWIDAAVNPATRTIRVRAELENPDGQLRANQFGQAEIVVGQPHESLFVPKPAVQILGRSELVFLAQSDGSYRPQRIATKPTDVPGMVEVTWGLKPAQSVVTTASFALKSELLKTELGAGCCE